MPHSSTIPEPGIELTAPAYNEGTLFTANKIKALAQLLSTQGRERNTMADEGEPGHPEEMTQARITVGRARYGCGIPEGPDAARARAARSAASEQRPESGRGDGRPDQAGVILATVTTAMVLVLARSLSTWLGQRHSDLTITVTGPDGRQISMSSWRIADPEELCARSWSRSTPDSLDGPTPPQTVSEPDTAGER